MEIVPIGLQCTNASFKELIGKRSETLPFDWIFATPKFVFEMLNMLLEKNMSIEELVKEHFFCCNKRADDNANRHHFIVKESGEYLYNSKYNAVFPHDSNTEETINKYVRRFQRLKLMIMESTEELCFIYTSQSSLRNGNFTIDGKEMVNDVYTYLSKIYDLIGQYRTKYRIIVFDAIRKDDKKLLNKNIIVYELNECNFWSELLPQMEKFKDKFI